MEHTDGKVASSAQDEQRLLHVVDEAIDAGLTVAALLDPASFGQAWQQFGPLSSNRGGGSLLARKSQPHHPAVEPLLLPLLREDAITHTALTRVARQAPAVIWLTSDKPLDKLLDALSGRVHAELADGRRPITLRYYDPRVLPELLRLLDPAQLNCLNEGIRAWWWFDRRNALVHHTPSVSRLAGDHLSPFVSATALSDHQVQSLLNASFVDRVIDLTLRSRPECLRAFSRVDRYEIAIRMIEAASTHRLESEFDCANYLAVAMHAGERFAEEPEWADLMIEVKSGTMRFTSAIEKWEERRANG